MCRPLLDIQWNNSAHAGEKREHWNSGFAKHHFTATTCTIYFLYIDVRPTNLMSGHFLFHHWQTQMNWNLRAKENLSTIRPPRSLFPTTGSRIMNMTRVRHSPGGAVPRGGTNVLLFIGAPPLSLPGNLSSWWTPCASCAWGHSRPTDTPGEYARGIMALIPSFPHALELHDDVIFSL